MKDFPDEEQIRLKHINNAFDFPFKAKVIEWQEPGTIVLQGDVLNVHAISDFDEKYGILVNTRFGRKKVVFPLLDLEPMHMNEKQKQILEDYGEWFINSRLT